MHPASSSLQIEPFSIKEGVEFLAHLTEVHGSSDVNDNAPATALSTLVGGHGLALTQESSLMFKKKWSISKYLQMYSRYPERVRDAHSLEMMHAGYSDGVKTVFLMSFQSLSPSATTTLGVLSLLAPDGIPEFLFSMNSETTLPTQLQYCTDEFE